MGNALGVTWADYHAAWASPTPPTGGPFRRLGPPAPRPDSAWLADSVRLLGCLAARRLHGQQQTLFPLPSFVLLSKEHGHPVSGADLCLARPRAEAAGRSSAGGLWPVLPPEGFEGESAPLLIDEGCLVHLLCGRGPVSFGSLPLSRQELAEVEPRVGIARDAASRTVRQGNLYSLQTHRWASRVPFREESTYGLHVLASGLSAAELGAPAALRLGGEGRLAWASAEAREGWLDEEAEVKNLLRQAVTDKGGWWLYLATPACFAGGWRPRWLGEDGVARPGGVEAGRLVGLSADAPLLVSGWDLATRKPKPVRRLMPEGTTLFFELSGGAGACEAALSLHGTCIADEGAHAGGGLAFVGAWGHRGGERLGSGGSGGEESST